MERFVIEGRNEPICKLAIDPNGLFNSHAQSQIKLGRNRLKKLPLENQRQFVARFVKVWGLGVKFFDFQIVLKFLLALN